VRSKARKKYRERRKKEGLSPATQFAMLWDKVQEKENRFEQAAAYRHHDKRIPDWATPEEPKPIKPTKKIYPNICSGWDVTTESGYKMLHHYDDPYWTARVTGSNTYFDAFRPPQTNLQVTIDTAIGVEELREIEQRIRTLSNKANQQMAEKLIHPAPPKPLPNPHAGEFKLTWHKPPPGKLELVGRAIKRWFRQATCKGHNWEMCSEIARNWEDVHGQVDLVCTDCGLLQTHRSNEFSQVPISLISDDVQWAYRDTFTVDEGPG